MPRRSAATGSNRKKSTTDERQITPTDTVLPIQSSDPSRFPIPILFDAQPGSSIPEDIDKGEFARQCKHAAQSSRIDPYVLHPSEFALLRECLTLEYVTTYLNIRNSILRLWVRSPMVAVTLNEAVGCAHHSQLIPLAHVAYEWLVRNGYINFGCVTVPETDLPPLMMPKHTWKPRIVIIGAGIAGIGCARQLDALFHHFEHELLIRGIQRPDVIVLEARNRIGGRMYSIPLSTSSNERNEQLEPRGAVELGAQIVTGFERGNPLNQIMLGQLGLHVHMMAEMNDLELYDIDGSPDKPDDRRVDRLFNDILDRMSAFKATPSRTPTVSGDHNLINAAKDPDATTTETLDSLDKQGKLNLISFPALITPDEAGTSDMPPAAWAARYMGWTLKSRVALKVDIDLTSASKAENASFGSVFDDAVAQYQKIVKLSPRELRVLNWHCANLEYSSAAPLTELGLLPWDQDSGNEFEGEHANVIGGYAQVPWALSKCPSKLDVRLNHPVTEIRQNDISPLGFPTTQVESSNGTTINAEIVVLSVPLGVLKAGSIRFSPPLPEEKTACIERMGYGLLNKVILVFRTKFWNLNKDAFGLLQPPENGLLESLNMGDYAPGRGAFHIFWDCSVASSRPTLVAMMAGASAESTEELSNDALISRALEDLGRVFGKTSVPIPVETFITRWRRDPFSRGSYSFLSKQSEPTDHDQLAKLEKPLFFAGEATCGTHPATVHGAYLSGLRAASEILDSLIGPIQPLKSPMLLAQPSLPSILPPAPLGRKRNVGGSAIGTNTSTASAKRRALTKSTNPTVKDANPSVQRPVRRGRSKSSLTNNYILSPTLISPVSGLQSTAPNSGNEENRANWHGDLAASTSSAVSTPGSSELYTSGRSTPMLEFIYHHKDGGMR